MTKMTNRAILYDALLSEVEFQIADRNLDVSLEPEVIAAQLTKTYMIPTRDCTIESIVAEWLDDYIILEEDWD